MKSDKNEELEPRVSFSNDFLEHGLNLHHLVEELRKIGDDFKSESPQNSPLTIMGHERPSRTKIFHLMDLLTTVLFPGYFGAYDVSEHTVPFYFGSTLDRIMRVIKEQIRRCFCFEKFRMGQENAEGCSGIAEIYTAQFMNELPNVRKLLYQDAEAAYLGDPAASSVSEVIFCYPGLLALAYQRISHVLYCLQIPILPRMITERAHSLTGIDIHPGATIEGGFFIDHGTGIVIGETAEIGKNVRIYQGVTLGAKSFPLDEQGNPIKGIKRHPKLEDDVTVYSGASILGDIVVGRGSVIGGNVWITKNVAPYSLITQSSNYLETFSGGSGI